MWSNSCPAHVGFVALLRALLVGAWLLWLAFERRTETVRKLLQRVVAASVQWLCIATASQWFDSESITLIFVLIG